MVVHVVRVASIPFGLSALVDEQPGSLVVWLLASAWSEKRARRVEEVLVAHCAASGRGEPVRRPDLHAL